MFHTFTSIFSLLDLIAFSFFLLSWIGYSYYSTNSPSSLSTAIKAWRSHWSQAMLLRENRIMDSQVINGLIQNVTFFASTSILILAGLFASLGAIDEAIILLNELPFAQPMTHAAYELRLFTLIILFTYAFFKYGWAMKQHSYSAMVMASVPHPSFANTESAQQQASLMAKLSALGAINANDAIRAYYFALAAIVWFVHTGLFMLATIWVLLILYRRDFHSKTFKLLTSIHEIKP